MTFPFYNPVTVQDPVDDDNPATKVYVDNGLGGKAETGHDHNATYSMLGHTHSAAATTAGVFDIARIPTGTSGTTVALGDHDHDSTYAAVEHEHAGEDITTGTVDFDRLPVGDGADEVAVGNDARFTDSRTPTAHASSHASGGSDPVTPAAIGAATTGHNHDAAYAALSHQHNASDVNAGTLDIARIPTGTSGTTVPLGNDARFTDARTPTAHAHSGADITSGTVPIAAIPTGQTGSTVPLGNDARFTDARTPTAHNHAGSEITSGTVPIAAIPTGTSGTTVALGNHNHSGVYANASHAHSGADITSGTVPIAAIPTGTSGTTVSLGNHNHSGTYVEPGDVKLSVKPWAPVTLTDAATVAVNAALGTHFRLTGTTTRAFGNPTNPTDGQVITFEIKASSGTPNHTWGSAYAFGSDITGTTALVAGKTDYVQFVYASSVSKWQCIGYVKGYTT